MYDKASSISLDEKGRDLLSRAGATTAHPEQTVAALREVIGYNDWRYYVMDDPALSDQEYDRLFAWLRKLEKDHPELVRPDSPTQRVASGLTRSFPTVDHLVPMLSLDNSYRAEDLLEWDRRARELTGRTEIEYCVEPKIDGAGISLVYQDDLLWRGATRGDGVQGEDITTNIKQIRTVPLSARFSSLHISQIEIRGEVLINKDRFKKFNEQRLAEGLSPLANPRNAASGSLRMVDPREAGKRGLEAFLYHVSYLDMEDGATEPAAMRTHYGTLKTLADLGFRTPVATMKVFKGIGGVVDYCREFEERRDELPYEIDGLVVKVNDFDLQDKMGMTTHHPRWAMAYKFQARQASSKLRHVDFQVGRTGSVTPVAKIDPVHIGGVTVTSVSLFNEDVVREKDLHIGDTVLVERAGDVIPYIVKAMADLRDGTEQEIVFPTRCPVCGDPLVRPEGESVLRCVNINCEAQVLERLIHFGSKDAMDIRSLGEANVRRFYALGLLKDIPGIYHLDFEKIAGLEGFGQKSADNLQAAIDRSRTQPLHRLIYALGIRHVGETTAKTLAHAVKDMMELKGMTEEKLLALADIGPKVASAILEFFANADNVKMLEELKNAGVNMKGRQEETGGRLSGVTFLFTGTLATLKRSEAEGLVEAQGGKIVGSVSSKLNCLVTGADPGSKIEKAKKIPTIRILTEEEFLKMTGGAGTA
jgi:DNA ligase (NAD+)